MLMFLARSRRENKEMRVKLLTTTCVRDGPTTITTIVKLLAYRHPRRPEK